MMNIPIISTQYYNYPYLQKSANVQQAKRSTKFGQVSFAGIPAIPLSAYWVRMVTYKKNSEWAKKMIDKTRVIAYHIQKKSTFADALAEIENCIHEVNISKTNAFCWGMRKSVCGYKGMALVSANPETRGHEYYQKYLDFIKEKGINSAYSPKSNTQYQDAITCKIISKDGIEVHYGYNKPSGTKGNLNLAERAYNELQQKENPTKEDVVHTAATIQWLIAQETPYIRGSDAIANMLSRSLMCSHGIQVSPLKEGVSCDFEAFYRDLDDYIKIYPDLFEQNPLK